MADSDMTTGKEDIPERVTGSAQPIPRPYVKAELEHLRAPALAQLILRQKEKWELKKDEENFKKFMPSRLPKKQEMIDALLDPKCGFTTTEPLRVHGSAPELSRSKTPAARATSYQKAQAVKLAKENGTVKNVPLADQLEQLGIKRATPPVNNASLSDEAKSERKDGIRGEVEAELEKASSPLTETTELESEKDALLEDGVCNHSHSETAHTNDNPTHTGTPLVVAPSLEIKDNGSNGNTGHAAESKCTLPQAPVGGAASNFASIFPSADGTASGSQITSVDHHHSLDVALRKLNTLTGSQQSNPGPLGGFQWQPAPFTNWDGLIQEANKEGHPSGGYSGAGIIQLGMQQHVPFETEHYQQAQLPPTPIHRRTAIILITDLRDGSSPNVEPGEEVEVSVEYMGEHDLPGLGWNARALSVLTELQGGVGRILGDAKIAVPSARGNGTLRPIATIEAGGLECDPSVMIMVSAENEIQLYVKPLTVERASVSGSGHVKDDPGAAHLNLRKRSISPELGGEGFPHDTDIVQPLKVARDRAPYKFTRSSRPKSDEQKMRHKLAKETRVAEIVAFLVGKLSLRDGWAAFRDSKNRVFHPPEVLTQLNFAEQFIQEWDNRLTSTVADREGEPPSNPNPTSQAHRIAKAHILDALNRDTSWENMMRQVLRLAYVLGPKGMHRDEKIVEMLATTTGKAIGITGMLRQLKETAARKNIRL